MTIADVALGLVALGVLFGGVTVAALGFCRFRQGPQR